MAGVAEDAERRFDDRADDVRDAEEEPDLGVGQADVGAHARPRRLAGTEDDLVDELDGEEDGGEGERRAKKRAGVRQRTQKITPVGAKR